MSDYKDLHFSYIGGKWRDGQGDQNIAVLNPYTEEKILSFKSANEKDVDEAYEAAAKAQVEWAKTTPTERRNIFDKAIRIMEDRKEELQQWMVKESGGTLTKAAVEWIITYEGLRVAAHYPYEVNGKIFPSVTPGKESRMYRDPLGVITVISPWNFASNLSMRSVAPALATGNAVVLKPAEDTPITGGVLIAKIFEEAGLPKGLLNVLLAKGSDIGDYMVTHPTPALISFTGSTPVGKGIAEKAGPMLKKLSLELGGNNAFIVLDDADIDQAVEAALFGKFIHQGQICMAINRILIDDKVYDEFRDKFVKRANDLTVGDPLQKGTDIGPVINEKQRKRILELIDKALDQGAKALTEKKSEGNVIHPLVLENVTEDMDIFHEEIFGPVASLIKFSGDEEAIRMANNSQQGLSGAVHSSHDGRALKVARSIKTGMIHINDQTINDEPNAVFGGEKYSGLGRFNGEFILEEFTTTQWVTVQHQKRDYHF